MVPFGAWLSGLGVPPWQYANHEGLLEPLGQGRGYDAEPYPEGITDCMHALDSLREGNVSAAAVAMDFLGYDAAQCAMGQEMAALDRKMPAYEADPARWRAEAEALCEALGQEGL